MGGMSEPIDVPSSVVLVVGSEQFTPPTTFEGLSCAASDDCVAVVVSSPLVVDFAGAAPGDAAVDLGTFTLATEGQLSVRDVYNRGFESAGVEPGAVRVTVWGDRADEPGRIVVQVHPD